MTLLEATIGTPWELDTKDSILVLEDRAMKTYQVDRVLMHLKQAGKFEGVRGIVLGDFPESAPAVAGAPSVREVCARILRPLGVPIVFGAPVGHTFGHAYDTAGHQGAPGRRWGRHTRIPGIGGGGLSETKHVHVIGIGGSAMAPLAGCCASVAFA